MKNITSADYRLKKKAQWQAHQDENWVASNIKQPGEGDPLEGYDENKQHKGKWVPHIKGSYEDGYAEYEVSIVREDYRHGFDSYGDGEDLNNPHAAKLVFADGRVVGTSWESLKPTLMEGAKIFADQMNSKGQATAS